MKVGLRQSFGDGGIGRRKSLNHTLYHSRLDSANLVVYSTKRDEVPKRMESLGSTPKQVSTSYFGFGAKVSTSYFGFGATRRKLEESDKQNDH